MKNKMTNREWLRTLTNKELAQWIMYDYPRIACRYSDSVLGMTQWFDEEYYEE